MAEPVRFDNEPRSVAMARRAARRRLRELGMEALTANVEIVVSELVTNAVLHTDGPVDLDLRPAGGGVRVNVYDSSASLPVVPIASTSSMTGRGLFMVRSVAARFGFEPTADGKVVWAELREERLPGDADLGQLIDAWADLDAAPAPAGDVHHVIELGDVPTDLLLAAKSHVDNLVREFLLAASGAEAGVSAAVPPHLAELIETVVNRFAGPRLSIKRQALEGARRGGSHVRLRLELDSDAADAGEAYLRALDETDAYCRAARLLTLETPPKHRVFRRWYVGEIVNQLRRADAGLEPVPAQPFEQRLLDEIDTVAAARAAAERAARLYSVASALAGVTTPEAVAHTVLTEGAAALGASGGGILLPAGGDRVAVPGTVGYDEVLVASLRSESVEAELPAAVALRTGEAVWLESREERDTRFPELADFERTTLSMCAVPLRVGRRTIGAIRFSFSEPRLFGEDERRFVTALAAQAAQALDRAQLYHERSEVSRRLQQGLLPPSLPVVPGVDVAAVYHPLGDGLDIGGDFYDLWPLTEGTWCFAIGDVCGTGPEAAAITAMVRQSLRVLTRLVADDAAALGQLNDVLLASGMDDERFCTVILGRIRPLPGGVDVTMASGGHPGPVLRRAGGDLEILASGGSLMGMLPEVEVVTSSVRLAVGDRLVFYTDGVTEARRVDGFFGDAGLRAATAGGDSAAEAADRLEAAVLVHSGGTLRDDLALLVMESVDADPAAARR